MDKVLPNILIKIHRVNDKLKFEAGDYKLVLNPVYKGAQTYPLLVLDKFITEVTTKLLQAEVDKQEQKKAVAKSLKDMDMDVSATDNVVKQLHEREFGN